MKPIIAEPNKQEFFITREFSAPQELVFRAYSDPILLSQWFLPKELKMEIDFMDCKTGGSYHHVHVHSSGKKFGFTGVYHEVTAPERIVKTSEFEGLPERGHVVLEITTFEKLAEDRTKVISHSICRSVADRDGMVHSGMEPTLISAHDQLDALLATQLSK